MARGWSRHSEIMRLLQHLAAALSITVALTGCASNDEPETTPPPEHKPNPKPTPTANPKPPPPEVTFLDEAGFIDLEPVEIGFSIADLPTSATTPRARVFYSFQPAEEAATQKPIFVFFNGGPGFATSLGLLGFNTAKRTLDPAFATNHGVGESPRPWTKLGNLLYLDAREAGFSYQVGAEGDHPEERAEGFTGVTFNPFTDGADMLRALLRFLAAHPALRDRPVILVGESYGGTRSSVMLNLVHHPERYEAGVAIFRDPALSAEVRAHFAATRPGEEMTPELAAAQFGRQILIEPALAGKLQLDAARAAFGRPGSPMAAIAAEHGVSCDLCAPDDPSCNVVSAGQLCVEALTAAGYDTGDLQQTSAEGEAQLAAAQATLQSTEGLGALLGVDPREIEGLDAASRVGAYRTPDASVEPEAEPIAADLGALPAWDRYFVGLSVPVVVTSSSTMIGWTAPLWGSVFVDNLKRTQTFITSARYDAIIHTDSLPDALRQVPGVSEASLDRSPKPGVARPGLMTIVYTSPLGGAPQTFEVRVPHYAESGHAVAMRQPVELFDDVAAWLAEAK